MNVALPPRKVWVRDEFLYDFKTGFGEYTLGHLMGVSCIPHTALLHHVLLDNGALFSRLPIHGLTFKKEEPKYSLEELELWDALSSEAELIVWPFLKNWACRVWIKGRGWEFGQYLYTVDFYHEETNGVAEMPDEYKGSHYIQLECGQIAIMPNNRIQWLDQSLTPTPFQTPPKYKVNTKYWSAENPERWIANDDYFYDSTSGIKLET